MEGSRKNTGKKAFDFFMNNAIYFVLLILIAAIIIKDPKFISIQNFINILTQSSTRVIFALGVGTIIVTEGTDLSLGRQVGLAAAVSASLLQASDYAYKMYPDLTPLWNIYNVFFYFVICAIFMGILYLVLRFTEYKNWFKLSPSIKASKSKFFFMLLLGGILGTLATFPFTSSLWDNYQMGVNIFLTFILVMILTGFTSFVNGFIVAKLKVPPFIATLGTMVIVYGLTSIYCDRPPYGSQPIGGYDPMFAAVAQGSINIPILNDLKLFGMSWQIPNLIVFAIITTAIMWFVWNKTTFGKNVFAVGGNYEAAAVSGVNVVMVIIAAYVLAGILYGFGGALEASRIGSTTNNTGNMYEMDAIAACIVGGLSFNGGIGSISGIIIGVLIFQVIAYGLAFISVNVYMTYIIKGAIIVTAVAIDNRKNLKKK